MGMLDWAENEVAIACKREAPDRKPGEWDYGCACYESALKAYKSLAEDGHSGMSWSLTKNILMRLMDGKPLTPIEDIPENWDNEDLSLKELDGTKTYQCKRMPSLFKYVDEYGKVTYRDIDRVLVRDIGSDMCFHNGLGASIVNTMFPITMPYCPADKPYVLDRLDFLTDIKNGDYDTIAFTKLHTPDGDVIDVSKYYAEKEHGFVPIDWEEFEERLGRRIKEDSDE